MDEDEWFTEENPRISGPRTVLAVFAASLFALAIHLGTFRLAVWVWETFEPPAWLIAAGAVVVQTGVVVGIVRERTRKRGVPFYFWYTFAIVLGLLALLSHNCISQLFW